MKLPQFMANFSASLRRQFPSIQRIFGRMGGKGGGGAWQIAGIDFGSALIAGKTRRPQGALKRVQMRLRISDAVERS